MKIKIVLGALLVISLLSYLSTLRFLGYQKIKTAIGGKTFTLYVAETPAQQEKGLSGISKLNEDEGMIFNFPKAGYYNFWMKDMKITLDFIFINNNQIVDIKENISPDTYPTTFTSSFPANVVIEINAGEIKKIGVKNVLPGRIELPSRP